MTTESFPVPSIKWTIEKSGDKYEVSDIDGDVSTNALEAGGVMAYAKIDILMEKGVENVVVKCSAVIEGLGERSSDQHFIAVSPIDKHIDPVQSMDKKESTDETKSDLPVDHASGLIHMPSFEESAEMFENKDSTEEHQYSDNLSQKLQSTESDKKVTELNEIGKIKKNSDFQEEERSRVLWIPLKAVDDIEDYQNLFTAKFSDEMEEYDSEEDFLRPSDIPEATILKQEKVKETVVHSPVSVPMVYSSSSTLSIQSILVVMLLSHLAFSSL